ncbi:class I histocompatibility antigen, F10 alpha chain-like [Mauremys reevesii]|uniref:class I histocompatibility antigen, F10 alpha chain-like n=1 Tax=Mauremys reevesii TaxID=260615 RepID=UPI00193F1307|nr:class I histocompatibility antigen, F10 alpha chain-like [Mauremys reevesii]
MTSSLGLRPDWTGPGSSDSAERESESAGTALVTALVRVSARDTAGHHSLSVLVTAVINEDGTHHFIMIARLDDVQFANYSSDTREVRATHEWVAQTLGAEFLQEKTQEFRRLEETFKGDIRSWMQLHNQTGGIHTEQLHKACVLSNHIRVAPIYQFAYDGRDFISFDTQTGTWVAAVQLAFAQKQRWEMGKTRTQYVQWHLQHECLDLLQRLLQAGRAVVEQQVPPVLSVSRRDNPDGFATLSCRARGFYPRPIHVSWVQDGEVILAETDSSGILPNADGTYYTQSSLEISLQQDGHRYACRVEHSSLGEPTLVWAPGKKGPLPPWVLAAIVLAVLVLAGAVGAGVILWRRKSAGPMKPGYAPAASE